MAGIGFGLDTVTLITAGASPIMRVSLGEDLVWPVSPGSESEVFDVVGPYTYEIPDWCNFLDIVLVGGGAGGNGGSASFASGHGGFAGVWQGITLQRGQHIARSVAEITGVVGDGGNAGAGGPVGGIGGSGFASTATAVGWAGLTAIGGEPRPRLGLLHQPGDGPGDFLFNSVNYVGGAETTSGNGTPGNAPGGAGRGGNGGVFSGSPGGKGGAGRVWIRAY
ncbi:hypothetical protein [Mycobacterium phage C3]|nr:hypothetical protein PBI_AN3_32 [Mycobacterium phage AN3]BBC43591.1 hypothetical protein [Mycobacterium phage C3]